MSKELEGETSQEGHRKKILAYVIASAILAGGGLFAAVGEAEGAERAAVVTQRGENSREESILEDLNISPVFASDSDGQLEVVVVDPSWDEIKQLATVEPSWEEFKALA